MNRKIKILLKLVLLLLIVIYYYMTPKYTFVSPIVTLFASITNKNFKENKILLESGININLKMYEWSYWVNSYNDRVIVNFTGKILDQKYFKFQMADMHILDKNISNDLFFKLSEVGLKRCNKVIRKEEIKNKYLASYTLCSNQGVDFIYYNIPSKKIMITFYPYTDDKEGQEAIRKFLMGIIIE